MHTTSKRIHCIVTACILIGCLSSIAGGQAAEKPTTIHVVTPEWEGYTQSDGQGVFFDLVRAVYEPIGITMTFEIVPWKRGVEMLEWQTADALLGDFFNEDFLFPRYPMDFDETSVIFKKSVIAEWKGIQSLNGKTLAWLRGYNYQIEPEMAGLHVTWREVDSAEQGLKMLGKDRVDGYLDTTDEIETPIETLQWDMALYQIEPLWTRDLYLRFAKTPRSEALIAIYDQRIPELLASGELQQIFEKWEIPFPTFTPREE